MNLLVNVLMDPQRLQDLSISQWNTLIRLSRYNGLLGTIAYLSDSHSETALPDGLQQILSAEKARCEFIQLQASREIRQLELVFENTPISPVLLKGSAYLLRGLPCSVGRRLSDVDLLVSQEQLSLTESHLKMGGWRFSSQLSDYDEYYYRDLTHELPPMTHQFRSFEVDLHHNLCSPISRIVVPSEQLLADKEPIKHSPLFTLSNQDMILHSAVHLFFNDELRGGLRDLYDISILYQSTVRNLDDFDALIARAKQINLGRPLFYALSALHRIFRLDLPSNWKEAMAEVKPNPLSEYVMTKLIDACLVPKGSHYPSELASAALVIKAYCLRMPLTTLVKHSLHKIKFLIRR